MKDQEAHFMRCCIACRQQEQRKSLLRFVRVGSLVCWDRAGRMPGRGAYLHADARCHGGVVSPALWARAFRTSSEAWDKVVLGALREELFKAYGPPADKVNRRVRL